MAYNPPYHRSLLEGAGCTPIQDLYAWRLDASVQPPPDLVAVARSAEGGCRFRSADRRHPDQEQRRFLEVVNAAFAHHWGRSAPVDCGGRPSGGAGGRAGCSSWGSSPPIAAAHLCLDTLAAARRGGYQWGELGWTLATNDPINRAIRRLCGRHAYTA